MPELPARSSLEQYKKQAKELVRGAAAHNLDALDAIRRRHPRFRRAADDEIVQITLADAQLTIARAHGFPSWPKFASHLETLDTLRALEDPASTEQVADPVGIFLEFASVERHGWHGSGSLQQAELIRSRYPEVATASIFTAAVLGDEAAVRQFLARDAGLARASGGPHGWDALTYLCFSRYLRLDKSRSEAFVATARGCWMPARMRTPGGWRRWTKSRRGSSWSVCFTPRPGWPGIRDSRSCCSNAAPIPMTRRLAITLRRLTTTRW